ncbi:MAG: hypothetical protein R2709_06805 [Marmoricola sp.]
MHQPSGRSFAARGSLWLKSKRPGVTRPHSRRLLWTTRCQGGFGTLDRLKDRLADPVGDRVVEALRIAREVGGGDSGRLRNLSGYSG